MTTSAAESIITRINKLLALAMDPSASEHERDLAQQHADRLMVQHELDRADLTVEERSKIVQEEWSFEGLDYNFRSYMHQIAKTVLKHCKCQGVVTGLYSKRMSIQAVGFPEDLAYAQTLWAIVFMELSSKMFPRWEKNGDFDDNVYAFVQAGFKWKEIHQIAWMQQGEESGLPHPYPDVENWGNREYAAKFWDFTQKEKDRNARYTPDGGKLGRAYRRALKKRGEVWSPNTSRHVVYRASYVASFSSELSRRFREMRQASVDQIDEADKYRLAVLDTEEQVLAEFYRLHPEYDPDVIRRRNDEYAASERARRAKMTPEQIAAEEREHQRQLNRFKKQRDVAYDPAGWNRGAKVAREMNLNTNRAAGDKKDALEA